MIIGLEILLFALCIAFTLGTIGEPQVQKHRTYSITLILLLALTITTFYLFK